MVGENTENIYIMKIINLKNEYQKWLKLRGNSFKTGEDNVLCYCGHTKYCECLNPDFNTFCEALKNNQIKLNDPDNGWK